MYPRKLQLLIEELLTEFRVLYLTGPRQAGKTTLARSVAEHLGMGYVTLDDQATLASVESDPHGVIRSLGSKRVVLDEFQYAPNLIPAIKEASDRLELGEKGKFLLTSSADIFRSARTQEALPGHMARLDLFPLSLSEIANQPLNIIDYLLQGDFQSTSAPFFSREELVLVTTVNFTFVSIENCALWIGGACALAYPAVSVKKYEAARDAQMGDENAVEVLPGSGGHKGGAVEALWS